MSKYILVAIVLVYGPVYAIDWWCGHCIYNARSPVDVWLEERGIVKKHIPYVRSEQ